MGADVGTTLEGRGGPGTDVGGAAGGVAIGGAADGVGPLKTGNCEKTGLARKARVARASTRLLSLAIISDAFISRVKDSVEDNRGAMQQSSVLQRKETN